MGYPTKVQLIKRRESEQWYINFPSAVARAMEFERGELWSGSSRPRASSCFGVRRFPRAR
jgi:hypothetical protein